MKADSLVRTIPPELAGQRLDQALAQLFPEYSRSRLKAWLLDGALIVDGGSPRPRDSVLGGETVSLSIEPEAAVVAEPEPIELDVVHEDDLSSSSTSLPVSLFTPGPETPRVR